jgi:hypothetical protein
MIEDTEDKTPDQSPPASGSTSSSSTSTSSDGTNEHTSTGPTPAGGNQLAPTKAEPGEGATTTIGASDRNADLADANQHLEVVGDPDGKITNTPGGHGTIQREPTPEELPSDAKIAPVLEQVNPNSASQAVGALPTPDEIAGVPQPEEGEKNVVPDATDATQFLPPDSDQHEDAERATEDAARDADRGRV